MSQPSSTLRNLTLASAKHLASQGHITAAHHKRIIKKAQTMPSMAMADEAPGAFGSLNPMMGAGAGHYGPGSAPEEG